MGNAAVCQINHSLSNTQGERKIQKLLLVFKNICGKEVL